MSRRSSDNPGNSQTKSDSIGEIGARFREERARIEPHQGRFAERLGVRQSKLSALETGESELRAVDLAAAAALGIDAQYVLTGLRSEASAMDPRVADLVGEFLALEPKEQALAQRMLRSIRDVEAVPTSTPRATLHTPGLAYHVEPPPALPSEAVLRSILEAQLEVFGDLSPRELAAELARRLPDGIARLEGVEVYETMGEPGGASGATSARRAGKPATQRAKSI